MKVKIKCSVVFVLFLLLCGAALAQQSISGREGEPARAEQAPRKIRVTSLLPDGDQPLITESKSGSLPEGPVSDRALQQTPKAQAVYTPVWKTLDNLSLPDKENALIQLEVPRDLPATLLRQVDHIEELWNSGNFDQAIERLRALGESEGIPDIAVGISWKVPLMISGPKWGTDVRIGVRDSIAKPCLDFHYATGNLFAVLKRTGDSPRFTVNISTDGGATWQETFGWAGGDDMIDLDAAVVDTFLYVGYAYGGNPTEARIRRFFTSNGLVDDVYFWYEVFNKNVDIEEVAVTTTADDYDNRIYYFAILTDNSLVFYWATEQGETWTEDATGISNADQGLDACYNEGFADYFVWVSFIDTDDTIHVARRGTSWDDIKMGRASFQNTSSVGAYQDRIMVVYKRSTDGHVAYVVSYNGGDDWFYGDVSSASASQPDVTARKGGGYAVVYHREFGFPDTCYYRRRDYAYGSLWAAPEPFNEVDVRTGMPMCVEWIPPSSADYCHAYGSVWIEGEANSLGAWFDRQEHWMAGDANGDGTINSADIIFVVNYLFTGGPAPNPLGAGDANCDGAVNSADVIYLVNYLFTGGPPPCCP